MSIIPSCKHATQWMSETGRSADELAEDAAPP